MGLVDEAVGQGEDEKLLHDVLDCGSLSDHERRAFQDMEHKSRTNRRWKMSGAQRDWLKNICRETEQHERDQTLLDELLEVDLPDNHANAFADMYQRLAGRGTLTGPQRAYAENVADQYGVSFERERTPVPVGLPREQRLLPNEQPGYRMPVPPNRVRCWMPSWHDLKPPQSVRAGVGVCVRWSVEMPSEPCPEGGAWVAIPRADVPAWALSRG